MLDALLKKKIGNLTSDEIVALKQCATHFQDGMSGKKWFKVILRSFDEVKRIEKLDNTLSFADECYKEVERVYPQLFKEKSDFLKKVCMCCLQQGDNKAAHKKMEAYLYNALSQVHYRAVNEKMPYYSFRSFSKHSLDDIKDETISLAHPREFNDPLDTILIYWLNAEIEKNTADDLNLRYRLLMKKVAEHIKIRCLIAGRKQDGSGDDIPVEDLNVLMWSHYADSHKGFCVRYEFDRELFDSSATSEKKKILLVNNIKYSDAINIGKEPSISMALFEKSDFWEYEHEMRMVLFDCNEKDSDFPVISCKGAAKAIYIGAKCSDANRRLMEKAIGDKNIPLYQMSVDECKLTRLKKTLIG